MKLTIAIANKAIMGAQIQTNGALFASYEGNVPDECISAMKIVQDHPDDFKYLVLQTMNKMPLFSRIFGKLVKNRLNQERFLASPLIQSVFDYDRAVEKRLNRISSRVRSIDSIISEHINIKKQKDKGIETDAIAKNLLAEILLLDFLVQAGFSEIERPYSQNQPHVDIVATKDQQLYAIEVTRKEEFSRWVTLEFGNLENCKSPVNIKKMRSLLSSAIKKKDDQFSRVVSAGTIPENAIRVVAIKTSDYGFLECANEAESIIQEFLSIHDKWAYVDCVWFVPNISLDQSKWVCRKKAG